MSGSRDIRFTNSQFRTIPALLKDGSGCAVDIHPQDAEEKGIKVDDLVSIATPKGKIR